MSVIAIVVAPELNLFHLILHTTDLNLHQWLICVVVALVPVVVTEIRKFVLRRREADAQQPPTPAPVPPQPATG
jgi:Ca2+-transporting ATPase